MLVDGGSALPGQGDGRVGFFADELFFDVDQPGFFEAGEVGGKVAFGQAGQALEVEKVGALAGGEGGHDGQPGRFVDEFVQVGQFFK